jgi:hypothetical protein
MTSGNTPIFQPNVIPAGYFFYGTGAFDDVAAPSRGTGEQIVVEVEGPDAEGSIEGQFFDHVYIIGGFLATLDAGIRDWCTLDMLAPASAPEDRTTTHDGNANKVSVGPFNIIVPAPLGDGDWNVDGAALTAGELNTDLCPVPNATGAGYWHWDPTQSPSIFPVTDPTTPDGAFDLYDATLPLARQANRYPLTASGNVTPAAAVKGKKVLPHWKWKFTVHREEAGTIQVSIRLDTARVSTL